MLRVTYVSDWLNFNGTFFRNAFFIFDKNILSYFKSN